MLTDGTRIWSTVGYYVKECGIAPESDFITYIRGRDYVPPTSTDVQVTAALDKLQEPTQPPPQ